MFKPDIRAARGDVGDVPRQERPTAPVAISLPGGADGVQRVDSALTWLLDATETGCKTQTVGVVGRGEDGEPGRAGASVGRFGV